MAITHPNAVRQSVCDHIVDKLDVGTGTKADMEILDGAVSVCVIDLTTTAFGAASSTGTATMNGTPLTGTAVATGATVDIFKLRDQGNTAIISGAIGLTGSDLNLSSTNINNGDKVQITSFTYTAMP